MRVSAKRDAVELGRERHAAAPENRPGRRDRRAIRRARVRELGGLLRLQQAKLTARQVDRLADELFGHVPTLGAARRVARTRRFAMSGRVSDHRRVTPPGEMPLQIQEAERLGHNGIGCEHLLLGILAEEGDAAAKVLSAHGVTLDGARSWTDKMVGDGWQDSVRWIYSPRANLVRRLAEIEAERLGQAHLGYAEPRPAHMLLALITEGEGSPARLFNDFGVNLGKMREDLLAALDVPGDEREMYLRQRIASEQARRQQRSPEG